MAFEELDRLLQEPDQRLEPSLELDEFLGEEEKETAPVQVSTQALDEPIKPIEPTKPVESIKIPQRFSLHMRTPVDKDPDVQAMVKGFDGLNLKRPPKLRGGMIPAGTKLDARQKLHSKMDLETLEHLQRQFPGQDIKPTEEQYTSWYEDQLKVKQQNKELSSRLEALREEDELSEFIKPWKPSVYDATLGAYARGFDSIMSDVAKHIARKTSSKRKRGVFDPPVAYYLTPDVVKDAVSNFFADAAQGIDEDLEGYGDFTELEAKNVKDLFSDPKKLSNLF